MGEGGEWREKGSAIEGDVRVDGAKRKEDKTGTQKKE